VEPCLILEQRLLSGVGLNQDRVAGVSDRVPLAGEQR
jgi:hypothetical protein